MGFCGARGLCSGATPRMGVGLLDWSADSRYLALRNDSLPMSGAAPAPALASTLDSC